MIFTHTAEEKAWKDSFPMSAVSILKSRMGVREGEWKLSLFTLSASVIFIFYNRYVFHWLWQTHCLKTPVTLLNPMKKIGAWTLHWWGGFRQNWWSPIPQPELPVWAEVSLVILGHPLSHRDVCRWGSFVNLSLGLRHECEARRAVWKVGLAVCARNLETRESRSASKISIGDSTCLLGFSACIFARLSSSIFKAETRTCRTKQILSFLIWKEGNGGQLGGLKGATDFFFFFYFNWRLITLQYCGSFCHTFTWISQGCTCVPHPEPPSHLPPHPIPVHQAWAPCLMHLTWTDFLLREMRE